MILRSRLLSQLDWMDHGFGTKAGPHSQEGMASLKQIHSAVVLEAATPGPAGEGDALITEQPALPVSIRTADCYPILLADVRRRRVAAIHAGWRGTNQRIVERAIEKLGGDPADLYAAIGPGIGVCCYEVGEEVGRLFGLEGRGRIDLGRANREQLLLAGIPGAQIEIVGECTFCKPDQFHSFRREKDRAGRMISYIALRG